MKITNRGFSITEIDPGSVAIDVIGIEGEETITLVTGSAGGSLSFSREEWRVFSAAVTAVNERLDGTPAGSDARSAIIDGEGDTWLPIPGTDKYVYSDGAHKTRDEIEAEYGDIREG